MGLLICIKIHISNPTKKSINKKNTQAYVNLCSFIDMTHRFIQQDFGAQQQLTNLISNV